MGGISDITAQQKADSQATRDAFERVWSRIQEYCHDRPLIELGVAGNIAGYCLFPVGWMWLECKVRAGVGSLPFYEDAESLGRIAVLPSGNGIIPTERKSTREGHKAIARSISYRRRSVEIFLANSIAKGEIPAFTEGEREPFHVRRIRREVYLSRDFL